MIFLFLIPGTGQITAYQPGEKIEYIIHYGLITGGEATLELKKDTSAGTELWHSKITGRTTGIVDALFKVKDIYESYMNPETELPVRSIRNISEGRYKRYNVVDFRSLDTAGFGNTYQRSDRSTHYSAGNTRYSFMLLLVPQSYPA